MDFYRIEFSKSAALAAGIEFGGYEEDDGVSEYPACMNWVSQVVLPEYNIDLSTDFYGDDDLISAEVDVHEYKDLAVFLLTHKVDYTSKEI